MPSTSQDERTSIPENIKMMSRLLLYAYFIIARFNGAQLKVTPSVKWKLFDDGKGVTSTLLEIAFDPKLDTSGS